MHPEIFNNYTPSPEIEYYENHKNGYEDIHYVKNSVEVWPTPISIDWLYQAYNDGQITSLSPYLQRVLLTKVWKIELCNQKLRSFKPRIEGFEESEFPDQRSGNFEPLGHKRSGCLGRRSLHRHRTRPLPSQVCMVAASSDYKT